MPEVSKGVVAAAQAIGNSLAEAFAGKHANPASVAVTGPIADSIERHTHAGEWRRLGQKIADNNFELTPAMRLCLTILLDALDAEREEGR